MLFQNHADLSMGLPRQMLCYYLLTYLWSRSSIISGTLARKGDNAAIDIFTISPQ